MATAEWYFDFISPFAYLQLESFDRLPASLEIAFKPILFAGVLNDLQHKGPAEIPRKRRFTYRHVCWLARHHGIALRFPPAHPFNPLRALRLSIALGSRRDVITRIFRYIWREGRSIDDNNGWDELTASLGVKDAERVISAQSVKDELRANGERAKSLGVFGVPSFAVEGELFWGFDATGMVADYASDGAWFSSAEIRRVDSLPATARRE